MPSLLCEDHSNQPWVIEVAALLASYAKIHDATKIPILFLYWDSPEEENRQLKTSLNA
jgi:hypothetical protein